MVARMGPSSVFNGEKKGMESVFNPPLLSLYEELQLRSCHPVNLFLTSSLTCFSRTPLVKMVSATRSVVGLSGQGWGRVLDRPLKGRLLAGLNKNASLIRIPVATP